MIDLEKLQKDLTPEKIVEIVTALGADRYKETNDYIVFPTICHNEDSIQASMKLYYYFDNQVFCCYTDCSETFNIFTLIDKRFTLLGKNRVQTFEDKKNDNDYTFYDILQFILKRTELNVSFNKNEQKGYQSIKDKYIKKNSPQLIKFNENVLGSFYDIYAIEWMDESISEQTMKYFNIKYSISDNKIIIPHYDINNNLIGIRGRTLNKEEAELFGKYRPIEIEGISYAHPLSLNLYGLNKCKEGIKRNKKVILMEGEKSTLKGYEYYKENNICVAVCGSHINKQQINLLIKNFDINEIIIAFDKEYSNPYEATQYIMKYKKNCNKYKDYCNFSIIIDKNNLLNLKDSPIDRGKETFEKLLKGRIMI